MNSVKKKHEWIDGSLYPETEVSEFLHEPNDKIDFIARLCSAWDFGVLPFPETLSEVLKPEWRTAVDDTWLLTSCAYHLLRELHGLPSCPYLGPDYPEIKNDPWLEKI